MFSFLGGSDPHVESILTTGEDKTCSNNSSKSLDGSSFLVSNLNWWIPIFPVRTLNNANRPFPIEESGGPSQFNLFRQRKLGSLRSYLRINEMPKHDPNWSLWPLRLSAEALGSTRSPPRSLKENGNSDGKLTS